MSRHRMILDVDTGIDDAIAILYALLSPEIKLEGISTGFGNIDVGQATENTLRLIKLAGIDYEVPVAAGAAKPLARPFPGSTVRVHGENGIGGAILAPSAQTQLEQSAAQFIVSQVNENPGEITLVTLARLTNLAQAIEIDPSIIGKFKSVVMMGGNVFAPGNVSPTAEANFAGDPEAAAYVFESGLPITVVGLDVTMKTLFTRAQLDYLLTHAPAAKMSIVEYLRESLEHYFKFYQTANNLIGACPMHDLLAVLVAINPSLVKKQTFHATIATEGKYTAGMVVTDRRAKPAVGKEVEFCLEVDAERAINQMMAIFL